MLEYSGLKALSYRHLIIRLIVRFFVYKRFFAPGTDAGEFRELTLTPDLYLRISCVPSRSLI